MKKLIAKNGQTYYYASNGKRVTKSEYNRRKKISSSLKKHHKKKTRAKKAVSTKWQKTSYVGRGGEVFNSEQLTIVINSPFYDNLFDIWPYIEEATYDLIDKAKPNLSPRSKIALGYYFEVRFNEHYKEGSFTATGFTPRMTVGPLMDLKSKIALLFDDLLERFDGYISRKYSTGVSIKSVKFEKAVSR